MTGQESFLLHIPKHYLNRNARGEAEELGEAAAVGGPVEVGQVEQEAPAGQAEPVDVEVRAEREAPEGRVAKAAQAEQVEHAEQAEERQDGPEEATRIPIPIIRIPFIRSRGRSFPNSHLRRRRINRFSRP